MVTIEHSKGFLFLKLKNIYKKNKNKKEDDYDPFNQL